jgi:M6 family metalloprotease-like protein
VRNNQTFGPVGLPNVWTDYFEQKKDDDGNVIDDRWSSSGGTVQTIVSRALADSVATLADFSNIDALIIVVSSPDATGPAPARFVWPHATTSAREFLCGPNAMTDRRSFNFVFVPLDFAAHDGRQMHSTLSHELGHTLGLLDLYDFPQYSTDITNRLTTDWEMMAGFARHASALHHLEQDAHGMDSGRPLEAVQLSGLECGHPGHHLARRRAW